MLFQLSAWCEVEKELQKFRFAHFISAKCDQVLRLWIQCSFKCYFNSTCLRQNKNYFIPTWSLFLISFFFYARNWTNAIRSSRRTTLWLEKLIVIYCSSGIGCFVKRPKWNADVMIFSDYMKHIKGTVRVTGIWPLVVSLSRTRNEPGLFPGANRRRSVSLRLMPLKNHLEQKTETLLYHSSQIQFANLMWQSKNADIRNSLTAVDWIWLLPANKNNSQRSHQVIKKLFLSVFQFFKMF